jgi:hypothetical protein
MKIKSILQPKSVICHSPIFIYADNMSQDNFVTCFNDYYACIECYSDKVVILSDEELIKQEFSIQSDSLEIPNIKAHIDCYFDVLEKIMEFLEDDKNTKLYGSFSSDFFKINPKSKDLLAVFYLPNKIYQNFGIPEMPFKYNKGSYDDIDTSILDKHLDILQNTPELRMINPSTRIDINTKRTLLDIFKNLYAINPSNNQFYMNNKNISIAGSSPCQNFSITYEDLSLKSTCGTAIKSNDCPKENINNLLALINSLKEDSDLSKSRLEDITKIQTVCDNYHVENYKSVEEYSNVYHTSSTITGKLKPNIKLQDVILAFHTHPQ